MRKFLVTLFTLVLLLAPVAVLSEEMIDINAADAATLEQIDGIGEKKAQAIIDYRTEHGPFGSVDDITKVKGIGPATLEKNRDRLTVAGAAPAEGGSQASPAESPKK